ncbi:MAG: A/G-specific adenine glycosylase [Gammaproteobacteria bacterium]|nr:A/G-specific adenine glycosylase [Gammaproteobacteria bacterium]
MKKKRGEKFSFSTAVLSWFDRHGRKDLPWQQSVTAYRVYVSEIMLQQTQVSTVIPYFHRFMEVFPDVNCLAAAPLDHVLHLWTGLGYYARARNLHKTAQLIAAQYRGFFPSSSEQLQSLPGVGRSTAGAICAIAFNQAEPILDGNVKRVLSRFYGVSDWPGNKKIEEKLWTYAKACLPLFRCRDYTQAMMDLGALLCTRTQPHCEGCPLKLSCLAFQSGEPARFPGTKPKKTLPVRQVNLLVIENEKGEILLQQRPSMGIWGGLWSLPECEENDLVMWCQKKFNLAIKQAKELSVFRHTFSHFHLDIKPIRAKVSSQALCVMEDQGLIWYDANAPQSVGLPKPICRILKMIEG